MNPQYEGSPELALPPFPDGLEWINVDAPLTLDSLRGKIVLFDFWTYGCINCMHMIPILHALEEKYADELVVIGVHSAKFANEGDTSNIKQIVQRYDITHPVINDHDFVIWRMLGINAWPTLVIVDPRGNVLAAQAGEIPLEPLDALFAAMIDHWDSLGELDRTPLPLAPVGAGEPARLLSFPGKVLVDPTGGRLFIADTGHHRVVIADLNTFEVLDIIGSGQPGYRQGAFDEAQFNQPQGMALHDGVLYIADTRNHAVRAADLSASTVDVIAGTGEMGSGGPLPAGMRIREPRAFQLRSPWDVTMGAGSTLFIASAGTHQIFEINLETRNLRLSVGNGREALLNRTLDTSELAQPSGLYFHDGLLTFADSESSTVRVADFTNNTVMTLSGTLENTLFDFGDSDGPVGTSRLQHPLGVTGDGDRTIYVADTYNHRIKAIDANLNTVTRFGRGGRGGFADGDSRTAEFDEPGGLDYYAGQLYVADTNNHVIRVIDLAAGTVSTVRFRNLERLQQADQITVISRAQTLEAVIRLPEQVVAPGTGTLSIDLVLPVGHKVNPDAPSRANFSADTEAIEVPDGPTSITSARVAIPLVFIAGTGDKDSEGLLTGTVTTYFCEESNTSLCFIDDIRLEIPVRVSGHAATAEINVQHTIALPDLTGMGGSGG
ncbi:MAG: thioredoxin-like domain-containing protein [Chloroflexota bacterium]